MKRLFPAVILSLLGILVFLVFYLSLCHSPNLTHAMWMPDWLGRWTNENPDLRTAVPYVLLAGCWVLMVYQYLGDQSWLPRRWRGALPRCGLLVADGLLALFVILCLTEALQFLLPLRTPSWNDVIWGSVGMATGWLCAMLGQAALGLIPALLRIRVPRGHAAG